MKQKLRVLKGDTDNQKMIRDFNIPLSKMNRITRQKINKKINDKNNSILYST